MLRIRPSTRPSLSASALFAGLMAAAGVFLYSGFTVDDAFITARLAHHISMGLGSRFNPGGPVVDAVTPLGFAHVLSLVARANPLAAWQASRWIGASLWVLSCAWLGTSVVRKAGTAWPLVFLGLLSPLGLWASSGMETAAITALVTFGSAQDKRVGVLSVALAAAWRPELIPFAFVLSVGRASDLRTALTHAVGCSLPAIAVAGARYFSFGVPYPLAVVAKPSDLRHGCWYALEALLWTGPLWLWLAPGWPWPATARDELGDRRGFRELSRHLPGIPKLARDERALALAILVHFLAVALAGGDWMPAYRLVVPVLPSMLRVACHVQHRSRPLTLVAVSLALTTSLLLAWRLRPSAVHVVAQRLELVTRSAQFLKGATAIASPDVGWVGIAFPGNIVDLAGATDAAIANLPGGHTSKKIHRQLFISRRVDKVVLLMAPGAELAAPWVDSRFARVVDYRAALIAFDLGCVPERILPLPYTRQGYLLLHCDGPQG